ncbi:related to KTI12 - Elongator associated protein [Melanopsichium pennsylvanicum]|uniref:Related to KTI12 - Elongator associated protein n=2 Tax=Melanopsichium pennsylvanicum TaxID=63383 RepID=A0AAJ5C3F0_9BASI|nr:related to KTI12-Elongator associated protein [Melanopsichium pennsylvanicum 4]SNX82561.1 related to KTI12 - Elongator associated protein [Melanopsichium pennsylvanicum]
MALIIVSGLASSGRSTRSALIKQDLERRIKQVSSSSSCSSLSSHINRVVIVSDHDVHVVRSAYSSQRTEKPARASYLSAVTRALGKDTIVIADGGAGLNIKGFRYQLWCSAREVGVRCLSVHVHAPPQVCKFWNTNRRIQDGEEASYDDETLSNLLMRFEEPNAMTRWDSPLIIVPTILSRSSESEESLDTIQETNILVEPIPYDDIWDAATKGSVNKAPEVVAPVRSTTANYLSILESSTQIVVLCILQYQSSLGLQPGVQLPINHSSFKGPATLLFTPPGDKPVTLASLQRIRRQFVRMHSSGSAQINQLGNAARSEGVHFSLNSHAQQASNQSANHPQLPSTEYAIASRFLAFLQAAL